MSWILLASAQEAVTAVTPTAATPASPNALMQFVPFIGMIAIMYFLIIRPQSKRQKIQQAYLSGLKRGDSVLTSSGIFGRIKAINGNRVQLDIADGVTIEVLRSAISGAAQSEEAKK